MKHLELKLGGVDHVDGATTTDNSLTSDLLLLLNASYATRTFPLVERLLPPILRICNFCWL